MNKWNLTIQEQRVNEKQKEQFIKQFPILNGIIQSITLVLNVLLFGSILFLVFFILIPKGSWINTVNGESMYPTLKNNQILYTDMSEIGYGDIITAYIPQSVVGGTEHMVMVKRVIGMPGDTVEIKESGVFINDRLIREPYLTELAKDTTYNEHQINRISLGADEYFLMGDNRSVSEDSRSFGAIKRENILYKQSPTMTNNFYSKLIFAVLTFLLGICIYAAFDKIVTSVVYSMLIKKLYK